MVERYASEDQTYSHTENLSENRSTDFQSLCFFSTIGVTLWSSDFIRVNNNYNYNNIFTTGNQRKSKGIKKYRANAVAGTSTVIIKIQRRKFQS